jgi:NADPH:quinone reductase-like Zn-dependent oxidoreductase
MTTRSTQTTATMTAAVVEEHGDIDKVQVKRWPLPEPRPGEVRLRVEAAALNRADLGLMRGLTGPGIRARHLPVIPGVDFAGRIDAVGEGAAAAGWREGEAVVVYSGVFCGACRSCRRGEETMCDHYQILGEEMNGGLAEFAVVPSGNLKRMPEGFPFDVAAAAPVAFTTAWRMLMNRGGLQPGDRVLVVGVGSGVSTAAIALARRFGARVLGTTREEAKAARALELGVEAVHVGYERPFDEWVRERTGGEGVDIVVDSVGAATWRQSIRSLTPGGKLVICGATSGDNPDISIREVYQQHRQILGAPCGNLREFHRVMDLVFAREVAPIIDRTFALADVRDALRHLAGQAQFGKVVVVP